MSWPVRLWIAGTPAPQGSKTGHPFVVRSVLCSCAQRRGRPSRRCRTCWGLGSPIRVSMHESSKRVGPWRKTVARAAKARPHPTVESRTPVRAVMVFAFRRPRSHTNTKGLSAAGREFPGPQAKTSHGDIEKLARAVADAVTGVLLGDDADIVRLDLLKAWTLGEPGLYLSVAPHAPAGESVETLLEAFGMAELRGTGTVTIAATGQHVHASSPLARVEVEVGDWAGEPERHPDLFAARADVDDAPFGRPLE